MARAWRSDLLKVHHLFVEMVDHDLGLEADGVLVTLDVAAQLPPGALGVELRVLLHVLDQPVVAVHGGVVLQHVHDEALLDSLLHRVAVEGAMGDLAMGLGIGVPEELQGPVLGGRGESEVAGVGQELLRLHYLVDPVLGGVVLLFNAVLPESHGDGRRGAPSLAGMGFVDDDGEAAAVLPAPDLVQDERELLDGGDDDLLARLDEPAQVARGLGMADDGRDLGGTA